MGINRMNLGGETVFGQTRKTQRELLVLLVKHLEKQLPDVPKIYKGGLFLGEHTKSPRFTQDVDVSILDTSLYGRFKIALVNFGDTLITEGVIATYEITDEVLPTHSGGAKFKDATGRVVASIDISLCSATFDSVLLDVSEYGVLQVSSIEQMLADKLNVLYSRKRFRRSKDLFDVWQIVSTVAVNTQRLCERLRERDILPLPLDKAPFNEEHIMEMKHAYDKLMIRDPFTELPISKPTYYEVVQVVGDFTKQFMEAEV